MFKWFKIPKLPDVVCESMWMKPPCQLCWSCIVFLVVTVFLIHIFNTIGGWIEWLTLPLVIALALFLIGAFRKK